ncbi:MAG: SpoIIE family protein phosphatase [Endomicrobium sp.]|jgi:sigma-B regulation protein RsbU (phosphoserine phosphatase)|nr:SpoIIE family protein phosphatase [Endomicrobium sp.]
MKLTGKIFLIFSLFSLMISFFSYFLAYDQFIGFIRSGIDENMLNATKIIEAQNPSFSEPDKIIEEGKEHSPEYQKKLDGLNVFTAIFGFKYIYLVKPVDGQFLYVLSSEDNKDMPEEELFTIYQKPPKELIEVCENQKETVTKKMYTDEYGTFLSCYRPIFKDGELAAVLGLDYDATHLKDLKSRGKKALVFVVVITLVIFLPLAYLSSRTIVEPLQQLTQAVENIGAGNFEFKYKIKGRDEVAKLGEAFNTAQDKLKTYIKNLKAVTADKERLNSELEIASLIQKDMLPSIFPKFSGNKLVNLYASMMAAKEVGGDFYDFFWLDENESKIVFVIADVSGKGVPAALFMVIAKTLIKQQMSINNDPAQTLYRVNNMLCEDNKHDMFVTALICSLDLITGKMSYANAGHNAPLISVSGKPYEFLKLEKGAPLGIFSQSRYKNCVVYLINGDKFYLYTDGINEAMNERDERFGNDRLLKTANENISLSPMDFDMSLRRKVAGFIGKAMQSDDMTSIAVNYKGTPITKVKKFDKELITDASESELDNVIKWISGYTDAAGYGVHLKTQIKVVAEELFVNIARYSYPPSKESVGKTVVRLTALKDRFIMQFEDEGVPFNPLSYKTPEITANIHERTIGGLGIHLVKKWMDEVTYDRKLGKNQRTVYKFRGR